MTLPPYRPSPEPSLFSGDRAVLATKHGKLACIAPYLAEIGVTVELAEVETDALGTFTGDVPRNGSPVNVAVAKARLGMAAADSRLGIASEGSFGPHPVVPWITVDREIVVLVDDGRGIVIAGRASSTDIVAVSRTVAPGEDLDALVTLADLPTHAVTVRPNQGAPHPVAKGLRLATEVAEAVASCAGISPDRLARVETDFRAHVCPRRRAVISDAAADLARRLASRCPACGSPGWGPSDVVIGIPCSWCGGSVEQVRAEIDTCSACHHREERAVVPEGAFGDPGACPRCNP